MKLVRKFNSELPETNDWFNHFLGRDFFVEPDHFFGSNQSQPKVNIKETEEGYQIDVAAPGYQKNDFKVEIDNNVLSISVEKSDEANEEQTRYSHFEYKYGAFKRSFTLPKGKIKESNITAQYNNGILNIGIPKTEEAKPKPKRVLDIQ